MMIRLRQVSLKTKSSLIIRLIDAYTCSFPVDREMEMYLENVIQKPFYKPEGYVVFTDLTVGSYVFHLRSKWYEDVSLNVELNSVEEPMMIHVVLLPRPNYPIGQGVTVIRGKVVDGQGRALSGVEVQVRLTEKSSANARLSQEAQKGDTQLSLNYVNGRMRVGERFWLVAGSALDEENTRLDLGEIVQTVDVAEDGKRAITLQEPLRFPHERGALLLPISTAISSHKGEIALFLPSERSQHYGAQLLFRHHSTLHVKEVRLEEGSLLNLGVITLAD